jgi:hypothetical protein
MLIPRRRATGQRNKIGAGLPGMENVKRENFTSHV